MNRSSHLSCLSGEGKQCMKCIMYQYNKFSSCKWVLSWECLPKSNKVKLGTQLTQSTVWEWTVEGLWDFSHNSTWKSDTGNKESTWQRTVQDLEEYSGTEQQLAHRAGIERADKKSPPLAAGEAEGDGRAEGLLAIGGGGQAAMSPMPDVDRMQLAFQELAS